MATVEERIEKLKKRQAELKAQEKKVTCTTITKRT